MTELKLKEQLKNLYENINNKEEKKEKEEKDLNAKYTKIINLIKKLIDNLDKEKQKYTNHIDTDIFKDVIESLNIIKEAYIKKSDVKNEINFFSDKIAMLQKFNTKKNKSLIRNSDSQIDNIGVSTFKDFEVYDPLIKDIEINEECEKIKNMLMNNEIDEEKNNINKLMITINNISEELTKLKPIDNEDIQKLKEQINAIQKELYKTHQVLQIEKKGKEREKSNNNI